MSQKDRKLSVLLAAGYMLVVTFSAVFHHHAGSGAAGCCGSFGPSASISDKHGCPGHGSHPGDCPDSKTPVPRTADDKDCPVCQYLAQKPAPVCGISPVASSTLVEEVAAADSTSPVESAFSAWHSRAPPRCK